MPSRRDQRGFYPIDWRDLSHVIRFERAGGRCERCKRPHGNRVWHLGETIAADCIGLWWDEGVWRDEKGRVARLPTLSEVYEGALRQGCLWPHLEPNDDAVGPFGLRRSLISLACCHLDHDPFNNTPTNLVALCQRCHLKHDAADNLARRRASRWAKLTSGMGALAFA